MDTVDDHKTDAAWHPQSGDNVQYRGGEYTVDDVETRDGQVYCDIRSPHGYGRDGIPAEHLHKYDPQPDIEATVTGDDRIHYGGQSAGTEENPRNTRSYAPNLDASMMGMTVTDELCDAIEREREIKQCECPPARRLRCTCSNIPTMSVFTCCPQSANLSERIGSWNNMQNRRTPQNAQHKRNNEAHGYHVNTTHCRYILRWRHTTRPTCSPNSRR